MVALRARGARPPPPAQDCAPPPPRAPAASAAARPLLARSFARSLAGFKVSARIHAHMLLPVWRHGQFPAPRSPFLLSLRRSHNFQEHGLKAPSPQRPSEILCGFLGFLRPFLFWGAARSSRRSPPLPRSQTCLLPSRGPGRSCLPEARRRRAAPQPRRRPPALGSQLGDPRRSPPPPPPAVPACPAPGASPPPPPAASSPCLLGSRLSERNAARLRREERPQRGSAFAVTF